MEADLEKYLVGIGADPEALADWTVHEFYRAGERAGFVAIKGSEIHVHPTTKRALTRKNIRESIAPILAEWGFATTRVPITETDHRLRTALGFRETWCDGVHRFFALTELPYEKRT